MCQIRNLYLGRCLFYFTICDFEPTMKSVCVCEINVVLTKSKMELKVAIINILYQQQNEIYIYARGVTYPLWMRMNVYVAF